MRDYLAFYLNGRRVEVAGPSAFRPLAEYLRDEQRLVATKIGCGEGDCGACSVLIGRPDPDGPGLRYRPAASCIVWLCQVDGAHVVTVEGIGTVADPSPVQVAMVAHHGSQCGFCTPGFVAALTAVFDRDDAVDEAALRAGLSGNLCRCTGYLPILRAGLAVERAKLVRLNDRYPPGAMVEALRRLARDPLRVEARATRAGVGPAVRTFARPDRVEDAVRFRSERPDAAILAGGTELGLMRNRKGFDPPALLSLAGVIELGRVARDRSFVSVGANVTWADLAVFAKRELPAFVEVVRQFASPQIKSMATLAGNVAYASPIADASAFLLVLGASVEVVGPRGMRSVAIGDFLRGDRQTDLAGDEIITAVRVAIPAPGELVRSMKVTKRKDQDVSTFRAGVRIGLDGDRIEAASVAFSGVGPMAVRLPEVERFLRGRAFDEATFRQAGRVARESVEPISDHRGSRDYRLRLAGSILLKFYHESPIGRRREAEADAR